MTEPLPKSGPSSSASNAAARRTPSRAFCLTVNNYTEHDVSALKALDGVLHLVCGTETAGTGTPHLQVYLRMRRPYRFSTMKRWFPTAHIEVAKSGDAAANYCRKEQVLFEIDNRKRRGERSDLNQFAKLAATTSDRELYEEFPGHFLRFGQHLDRIRNLNGTTTRDAPDVYWYYGPTGTGKTRKAWDDFPDLWPAPPGKIQWFDGYTGQAAVLFDDLRPEDVSYSYLLRLLDRYPMRVPIKGGFVWWKPTTIIITAPKDPQAFFEETVFEDLGQLKRRITNVTHFNSLIQK